MELRAAAKLGERYPQMPTLVLGGSREESSSCGRLETGALEASAWPLVIEPGDLAFFSGAHLHGSVVRRLKFSGF